MASGILGKKIGMTQIFNQDGRRVPVTILEAGPCVVQAVRATEKNGYNAVQLGFGDAREKTVKKPQLEEAKKNGLTPKKFVREIIDQDASGSKVGDKVTVGIFQKGDYLDIEGVSKGKGFQGGMKRRGWSGGKKTHGSKTHRAPGSIGASSFPSKVDRGHPGPGQMGNEKVTVQNIEVVDVDKETSTLVVKGAVPGANGGYIVIKFAKKKPIAEREEAPEEEQPEEEVSQQEQVAEEVKEDVQPAAETGSEDAPSGEAVADEAPEADAPVEKEDNSDDKKGQEE